MEEYLCQSLELLLSRCSEIFRRTEVNLFFLVPFLLALSSVFIINDKLTNGVVSGKYFWSYGSMGLVSIATLIYSFTNKQSFRFSLTECLYFLESIQ